MDRINVELLIVFLLIVFYLGVTAIAAPQGCKFNYIYVVPLLFILVWLLVEKLKCFNGGTVLGFSNAKPGITTLKFDKNTLVLLHSNSCGHCHTLRPTWDKVKKSLSQSNPNISVVELEHSQIDTQQFPNIKGYPTIVLVKPNGQRFEYSGDRSFDSIVSFAQQ